MIGANCAAYVLLSHLYSFKIIKVFKCYWEESIGESRQIMHNWCSFHIHNGRYWVDIEADLFARHVTSGRMIVVPTTLGRFSLPCNCFGESLTALAMGSEPLPGSLVMGEKREEKIFSRCIASDHNKRHFEEGICIYSWSCNPCIVLKHLSNFVSRSEVVINKSR